MNTSEYASIFDAAKSGDIETVYKYLDSKTCDIADGDADGYTILHYAALNGHHDLCFGLIWNQYSVDVLRIKSNDGLTPIMCAAQGGHTELCTAIAQCYGTDQLDERDEDDRTAEEIAMVSGKLDTANAISTVKENFNGIAELTERKKYTFSVDRRKRSRSPHRRKQRQSAQPFRERSRSMERKVQSNYGFNPKIQQKKARHNLKDAYREFFHKQHIKKETDTVSKLFENTSV